MTSIHDRRIRALRQQSGFVARRGPLTPTRPYGPVTIAQPIPDPRSRLEGR
jgi:hypothetical protein